MLPKLLGALAAFLLLSVSAVADTLIFTLDQSTLYSPPGGISQADCTNSDTSGNCVIFTGTISTGNDVSQDYFLDALFITMDPSNPDGGTTVLDNTPLNASNGNLFFLNATSTSGLLGPDSGLFSYSGGIFEVDVLAAAAAGIYNGTATIDFTDEINCTDTCTVSTPFTVVVVPEPDALFLAGTGLAALAAMRRRFAARS